MRNSSTYPPGFALIEVIVAIAIGAMILTGARLIYEQISSAAEHLVAVTVSADGEANAERMLRTLVGRVDAATVTNESISGGARAARLATWCDMPQGWLERCQVVVSIEEIEGRNALLLTVPGIGRSVVRRGFESGRLEYLSDPRGGGEWTDSWRGVTTTPIAIRMILDQDTLFVRIGERG